MYKQRIIVFYPQSVGSKMPLIKSASKKAFGKNVSKETKDLEAKGKSPKKAVKQAVAIAYSEKKAAKKREK
jgi:hypothetical protein